MRKRKCWIVICKLFLLTFLLATTLALQQANADDNVTLAWDANDPTPEGYEIYGRPEGGTGYEYDFPIWTGTATTATVQVDSTSKHYFVCRAFDGLLTSGDSNEVTYYGSQYDDGTDTDGDGLTDMEETNTYGTDPNLADTDSDGINDGSEVSFWASRGSSWNSDTDGDGLINILDDDADGDGAIDGSDSNPLEQPSVHRRDLTSSQKGAVVGILKRYMFRKN